MTLRRDNLSGLLPAAKRPRVRTISAHLAIAAIGLSLAGCGGSGQQALPTPLSSEEVAARAQQPLTALGPCTFVPTPGDIGEVDGLVLPPDAVLIESTDTEGLVNLRGYVAMTPVQVRLWFEAGVGASDFELLSAEDETHEAEVLVKVGAYRMYFKAAAICELGSAFVAVVAPDGSSAAVPTPTGSAASTG